ncbi:MAG: hypothetical protein AAFO07_04900 [Bacteroidota bacterium]
MSKNYRKIPRFINSRLELIDNDEVIVASVLTISEQDLANGKLKHIGIQLENGKLDFKSSFIPNPGLGRYCKRNLTGKMIIRRDLPKVNKRFNLGSRYPFGDPSKGSFTLVVTKQVYQRELIEPRKSQIEIDLVGFKTNEGQNFYTFVLKVNSVLSKTSSGFDDDLLYALNLLQEVVHKLSQVNIFPANIANNEFLKFETINWDIFPPGNRDIDLSRILRRMRRPNTETQRAVAEKYDTLVRLNPEKILIGLSGLRGYFGAKFADDLVVFEHLKYGNAIYVLYQNWEETSKLSRTDIKNLPEEQFDRILHTEGWKDRLTSIVRQKRA